MRGARLSLTLDCVWLALLCAVATLLAITLARVADGITTVPLADGFILALLLSRPRRHWVIFLLAAACAGMAVAFAMGRPGAEVVPTVTIQSAGILAAAWLLHGRVGMKPDLSAGTPFLHFLAVACVAAPAGGSAAGALVLHRWSGQPLLSTFVISFAAIAIGNAFATPLGLSVLRGDLKQVFVGLHAWRRVAAMVGAVAVTLGVFLQERYPLLFLIPPVLSAVAGLIGSSGIMLLMPALACIVLACTGLRLGPFSINPDLSAMERLVLVQMFSCACLLLARTTANLVETRKRALCTLRAEHDALVCSQQAVAASEARFRLVAENASDVIIWAGPDRELLYVSPALPDVFGVSADVFMAHGKLAFVHPQNREQVRATTTAMARGGLAECAVRYRVVHAERECVWVEARMRALPAQDDGGPSGYISVIRDITTQVLEDIRLDAKRQALELANERTRLAADSGGIGIWDWNLIDNTMYWDDWMCRLYGIERPENSNTFELWGSMLHPDDREASERLVTDAIAQRTIYEASFRIVWPDGSVHTLKAFGKLVFDDAGAPARMIGTNWDITRQRALEDERDAREREMRRANAELDRLARHFAQARKLAEQADRAKTKFLASMSHELRTPLHGILGYAQLLDMDGGLTPMQAERVQSMMVAGTHLLKMVSGVLELSEAEAGAAEAERSATDIRYLAACCLDIVRPQADGKRIALLLDVAEDVPARAVLDARRLRQVLLNLLGNAVKYTREGAVRLRVAVLGARLRLEVIDTGPGIPEAKRHLLFEEFERLGAGETDSQEGAGLGLSLARRLSRSMDGTIGQENHPDGGSIFWLEVPLVAEAPVLELAADPAHVQLDRHWAANSACTALRVLVVDDVEMNRDIATAFIRTAGYDVACAAGGEAAVELIASEDFLIVLMDVQMPGVDGLEATRRVRRLDGPRCRVPIVAMTAQTFAEQLRACREAGMATHLAKPFTLESLLAAIESGLSLQAVPAGGAGRLAAPARQDEVPIVDEVAMTRTTSFLNPEMVVFYMNGLIERALALRDALGAGDFGPEQAAGMAEAAHVLAGSGGMFGFERLVQASRRFEHAATVGGGDVTEAGAGLLVILEESVAEMRRRAGVGKESVFSAEYG